MSAVSSEQLIVVRFSLSVTVLGTVFNVFTFIILCRSTFRSDNVRPVLHYMRTMAIFDILMLYGWNLDHYLEPTYGFKIQTLNVSSCRFLSFLNYFAAQSSAWLRVFVSLDQYIVSSRLHRPWFSQSKSVLIIISCIIGFFTLLNSIFFVYGCSKTAHGTISELSWAFQIYPLWDYINLAMYNCLPFLLMTIFNSGVIYHLIRLRQTTAIRISRIHHRAISLTLVISTFLFLLMTTPATVAFAFFTTSSMTILHSLDGLLYSYHTFAFPIYFITLPEFRRECIGLITFKRRTRSVEPFTVDQIPMTTSTQAGTSTSLPTVEATGIRLDFN